MHGQGTVGAPQGQQGLSHHPSWGAGQGNQRQPQQHTPSSLLGMGVGQTREKKIINSLQVDTI